MTAKQWRLLEAIEDHDRCGTMEVLLAMEYAPDDEDSEASREKAWNLTKFVVGGMVGQLVKKGLATHDADGYGITARGRELLAKRKAKVPYDVTAEAN
jgi:hypothetical protein